MASTDSEKRHIKRLDDATAQDVVLIQHHAAHYRQPAFVQRGVIAVQVFFVLAVTGANLADGGHAKADHVAVGMGGIALEIALQAGLAQAMASRLPAWQSGPCQ
jgi:hypothetical protein